MRFVSFVPTLIAALTLATAASAVPVDLGAAGHYTILGAGVVNSTSHYAGQLKLGSEAHVFGSAGGRDAVYVSPGVQVDDDLSGGDFYVSSDLIVGGTYSELSPAEWSLIHQDMIDASSVAAALPDQTVLSHIFLQLYRKRQIIQHVKLIFQWVSLAAQDTIMSY